jgi:hypothetical protein
MASTALPAVSQAVEAALEHVPMRSTHTTDVITGLVPVISINSTGLRQARFVEMLCPPHRDGRDKPGHDDSM